MTRTAARADADIVDVIFGPVTRSRTYLNILYLLLAFPLGLGYFVFLTVGLSVGTGLVVIFIGVPVLLAVLAASRGLGAFERKIALGLLDVDIPPSPVLPPHPTLWPRVKALCGDPATWKSIAYLMIKFPFGVASFVVLVTAFSVSISLALAPLIYTVLPLDFGIWQVSSETDAAVCSLVGVLLLVASMHLVNAMAMAWGQFARTMLG